MKNIKTSGLPNIFSPLRVCGHAEVWRNRSMKLRPPPQMYEDEHYSMFFCSAFKNKPCCFYWHFFLWKCWIKKTVFPFIFHLQRDVEKSYNLNSTILLMRKPEPSDVYNGVKKDTLPCNKGNTCCLLTMRLMPSGEECEIRAVCKVSLSTMMIRIFKKTTSLSRHLRRLSANTLRHSNLPPQVERWFPEKCQLRFS